jgi:MerR family transcriptional regulator/heat shock protein HspR
MSRAESTGTGFGDSAAVFVISVAAELAGMHPQTLRQYDRLGLVSPRRTPGRGRRYSPRDIEQLREVQRLSQQEGMNLAGIKRILELENEVHALRSRLAELEAEREQYARLDAQLRPMSRRVFSAGAGGDIVSVPLRRPFADPSTALVVWRPRS